MGGFTRPRDLRSSNWFPGGRYEIMGKVYESPPEAAYEPHTVFLLESRYPVRHGIGRVDCYDHVVGVCREGDFEAVLKRYNSNRAPRTEQEAMDNARWPWQPPYRMKRTRWWADDENPADIMKELYGDEAVDNAYLGESGKFEEFEVEAEDAEDPRQPSSKKSKVVTSSALIASLPSTPSGVDQRRTFHSSTRTFGAHSYNEDHIVPDFYLQHKRRKNPDTSAGAPPTTLSSSGASQTRPGAAIEHSLMEHLSDSILSDNIAASTMRRPKGKIPHEHFNEEGILVHPSGYVIPTPGDASVPMSERRLRDVGKQTIAVAERVLEEGDYSDINAHTRLQDGKVPFEVIEEDGTVSHPSGFVPPTPQHQFKYSDSSSVDNHIQDAVQRQRRRATTLHLSEEEMEESQRKSDAIFEREDDDAELIAEVKAGLREVTGKFNGSQKRGIHTSPIVCATEVSHPPFPIENHTVDTPDDRSPPPHLAGAVGKSKTVKFPRAGKAPKARSTLPSPPAPVSEELQKHRATYLPTLAENPFWRPLLTITVSTRPLAVTLARLSRAHPRGLPFYASISNDDRKAHASYSDRMRNMRLDRMGSLAVQMAQLLAGARGGFIGIRFGTKEKGRGIHGQGFGGSFTKGEKDYQNWSGQLVSARR